MRIFNREVTGGLSTVELGAVACENFVAVNLEPSTLSGLAAFCLETRLRITARVLSLKFRNSID